MNNEYVIKMLLYHYLGKLLWGYQNYENKNHHVKLILCYGFSETLHFVHCQQYPTTSIICTYCYRNSKPLYIDLIAKLHQRENSSQLHAFSFLKGQHKNLLFYVSLFMCTLASIFL